MNKFIFISFILFIPLTGLAQKNTVLSGYFRQSAMVYVSKTETLAGLTTGVGFRVHSEKNWFAQSDFNIFWGNGSGEMLRLSAGIQRHGTWAPAASLGMIILRGHGPAAKSSSGKKSSKIIPGAFISLAPIRFEYQRGFVSALEINYGGGRYNGLYLELTLLSLGFNF